MNIKFYLFDGDKLNQNNKNLSMCEIYEIEFILKTKKKSSVINN